MGVRREAVSGCVEGGCEWVCGGRREDINVWSSVEGHIPPSHTHTHTQHSKINHKTDLIVRELTDLIASQPGPSSSHHGEASHLLFTHDKSFSSFESKLAGQHRSHTVCHELVSLESLWY